MIYYKILHTVAIELQNAEDIWTVRFFFFLFVFFYLSPPTHSLTPECETIFCQSNKWFTQIGTIKKLKHVSLRLIFLCTCFVLFFVEGRVFIKPFSLPQICKIASAATANSVHVYCCLCLTNLFSWVFFSVIEKPSDTHLARLKRNHESKSSGWGAKSSQRQKSASNWCADFNATLKTTSYHT